MKRAERSEDGRIGGRSVGDIAETVAAADGIDAGDSEEILATLRGVAADGAVTEESVRSALAHLSKVVSTPATRVELSGIELESAREDASEVTDVPTVAMRLDGFAAERARIESAVADLDGDLRALTGRAEAVPAGDGPSDDEAVELYEIAAERRRIHAEATRLQGVADDLTTEIESFRRWVSQASVRHDELRTDAGELARAIEALEDSVASIADADDDERDDGPRDSDAEAWFDCVLRHRVLALQTADLRAAAADVETVDDRLRADSDGTAHDDVHGRVDDLRPRLEETADRLDTLARPEWRDRFSPKVAAFEEALDAFEPPVEWSAVLTTFREARDSSRSSTHTQ